MVQSTYHKPTKAPYYSTKSALNIQFYLIRRQKCFNSATSFIPHSLNLDSMWSARPRYYCSMFSLRFLVSFVDIFWRWRRIGRAIIFFFAAQKLSFSAICFLFSSSRLCVYIPIAFTTKYLSKLLLQASTIFSSPHYRLLHSLQDFFSILVRFSFIFSNLEVLWWFWKVFKNKSTNSIHTVSSYTFPFILSISDWSSNSSSSPFSSSTISSIHVLFSR